jgi:hypothetical protein
VPGTDCGFGTFVGFGFVEPEVTWLKLAALSEGAAMASDRVTARACRNHAGYAVTLPPDDEVVAIDCLDEM